MDPVYNGPAVEARSTNVDGGRLVHDVRTRLDEDPFFYGHRWVDDDVVPLTEDDLLDPQEGDHVSEHTLHQWVVSQVYAILKELFFSRGHADVLVGGNLKMLWRESTLKKPAPDVVVIPGVDDPTRGRKSYDEAKEGAKPTFVLEVTSEATSKMDFKKKPRVYEQAGVEEFFILHTLVTPWTLEGRRLNASTGRYRKLRPNREGRLLAASLNVLFAIGADGRSVDLFDAGTGEKLRDLHAEAEARREAEQRLREETEARQALEEKIRRLEAQLAKDAG